MNNKIQSDPVAQQVASDLRIFLNQSRGHGKGLSLLSKKTNLSKKTIGRLISFENSPSAMTVFKIYQFLLNLDSEAQVIESSPAVIKKYLVKKTPKILTKLSQQNIRLTDEIKNNPVAIELIVLLSTGPLKKSEVFNRFGQYGLELIASLIKEKMIIEQSSSDYKLGEIQNFFDKEFLLKMGLQMASTYSKPQQSEFSNQNCHYFYAEGLSQDAFIEWLKIDEEAFRKKLELLRNPTNLGPIRTYTFSSTDQLKLKKKE